MNLPKNEPIYDYGPGDARTTSLKQAMERMASEVLEIPCIIGGEAIYTGQKRAVVMPHDHGHVLAHFHLAGEKEMAMAAASAAKAKESWSRRPWQERVAIFQKMADLLATTHRDAINGSTILGQSKTVYQAEIDAACEFIDFLRFNGSFYESILKEQPLSVPGIQNRLEYRPLEGFVTAITPFNFTSIAANLALAPALVGNTCIWKPSDTQMLSAHYTMKLMLEAGLPADVIQFLPADGPAFGNYFCSHRSLGGIHFTGSTQTFQWIWKKTAENLERFQSYPRLVGETGGKDFILAHRSANVDVLAVAAVRGAFEYQGQKCSAASRMYVPEAIWPQVKSRMLEMIREIKVGDPRDFSNFMGAVIDQRSFKKIQNYQVEAKGASGVKILAGGGSHGEKGYFVEPTVLEVSDPKYRTMCEEIFGPILSIYVYPESKEAEVLRLVDESTPYALTGALVGEDAEVIRRWSQTLQYSAGNLYINDKPTGAVVGQQPFGGARASGTNDKAGSGLNLTRWISPRTVKENLAPPKDYRYPHMAGS